jgi:trimethylamine:corrinoid methyltransferase-like protein
MTHGFDFDGYDMALDVVKQVGSRNNFLTEKHTVDHLKDFRLSSLLNKQREDGEPLNPSELALKEFKRLEANHKPEPLATEVLKELDRIVAAADHDAEK